MHQRVLTIKTPSLAENEPELKFVEGREMYFDACCIKNVSYRFIDGYHIIS